MILIDRINRIYAISSVTFIEIFDVKVLCMRYTSRHYGTFFVTYQCDFLDFIKKGRVSAEISFCLSVNCSEI